MSMGICMRAGWPTSRLRTVVVPSASAASSRMRLDSDLDPGSLTWPEISLMGSRRRFSKPAGADAGRAGHSKQPGHAPFTRSMQGALATRRMQSELCAQRMRTPMAICMSAHGSRAGEVADAKLVQACAGGTALCWPPSVHGPVGSDPTGFTVASVHMRGEGRRCAANVAIEVAVSTVWCRLWRRCPCSAHGRPYSS
eukprot:3635-Chlamydomonas_euryale.AAC.2